MSGCDFENGWKNLYISHLCGSPAFPIFNEFRDFYKNQSTSDLWPKISDYKYLDLGSLSSYNTVMFYHKQGMLIEEENISSSIKSFGKLIQDYKDVDDEFDSATEYAEFLLPFFESGECTPENPLLNVIFEKCQCGGKMYLFPDEDVKLGDYSTQIGGTSYYSVNYLTVFKEMIEKIIKGEISDSSSSDSSSDTNSGDETTEKKNGSGIKGTKFYEELKKYGINPSNYLKEMKKKAKKAGYDEKQLNFDNDDKHKLKISTEQGVKHFGAVGYKDFYIYKHLEKTNKVPKGESVKMRNRFRKSHTAISKKKKLGRNSANELAINILW